MRRKVCSLFSTTTCMSDILCVTNRSLCTGDFLTRIEKIARCRPAGIILREKDLSAGEYKTLAGRVLEICAAGNTPCILHSFADTAIALGAPAIHLPLHMLHCMSKAQRSCFKTIGVSCHSLEDAAEARRLGCSYIIAGHIFKTYCKRGLPGRGLDFLQSVCKSVSIPVYGIGGIGRDNIGLVYRSGAAGACVMSGAMSCEDADTYFKELERSDKHVRC